MSTTETKDPPKATPPPKVAPPEKPEETAPAFEKSITDNIKNQFGDDVEVEYIKENRIRIKVSKEKIYDIAKFIKDQTPFDHAESVTGVDFPEDKEIGVTYHLGSYTDPEYAKQVLALSTRSLVSLVFCFNGDFPKKVGPFI